MNPSNPPDTFMPANRKTQPGKAVPVFVPEKIAPLVDYLRHEKIILDSDRAELYGVTIGNLNKSVQRNLDRFPADFMFQLTADEMANLEPRISASENTDSALIFQSGTSKGRGGRRHLPYAFIEQGVAMLSSAKGRISKFQSICHRAPHVFMLHIPSLLLRLHPLDTNSRKSMPANRKTASEASFATIGFQSRLNLN
jgi:hypothetical protein